MSCGAGAVGGAVGGCDNRRCGGECGSGSGCSGGGAELWMQPPSQSGFMLKRGETATSKFKRRAFSCVKAAVSSALENSRLCTGGNCGDAF